MIETIVKKQIESNFKKEQAKVKCKSDNSVMKLSYMFTKEEKEI